MNDLGVVRQRKVHTGARGVAEVLNERSDKGADDRHTEGHEDDEANPRRREISRPPPELTTPGCARPARKHRVGLAASHHDGLQGDRWNRQEDQDSGDDRGHGEIRRKVRYRREQSVGRQRKMSVVPKGEGHAEVTHGLGETDRDGAQQGRCDDRQHGRERSSATGTMYPRRVFELRAESLQTGRDDEVREG